MLPMLTVLPILGLALLGSVLALIGGLVFLLVPAWSKWLAKVSVPFAAGVLLTVTLVGLIPETIDLAGEDALVIVLAAFLASYFFEQFVFALHHHEDDHHHQVAKSVPLVVVGDTIHNFVDGVAIAASYLVNPGLGVITAISTFLHEVPHEIGDFGLLLKAGWSKTNVLKINFFSALATFVGVGFVWFFPATESILGYLIAAAAGLFLYLGASDFLPQLEKGQAKTNVVALLAGVAIMLSILYAIPHEHEDEGALPTDISSQVGN